LRRSLMPAGKIKKGRLTACPLRNYSI